MAGLAGTVSRLHVAGDEFRLLDFTQLLESGINDLVLTGAAIWFLLSLETRIKRHRALAAIHEMRAIAHVIDMHQLTKAPETVLGQAPAADAAGGPARRALSSADLALYLDYCSELLSLTGKVAVLYVQDFDDGAARDGVNDVEELTNGLSRKIWQKMTVVRAVGGAADLVPCRSLAPAQVRASDRAGARSAGLLQSHFSNVIRTLAIVPSTASRAT